MVRNRLASVALAAVFSLVCGCSSFSGFGRNRCGSACDGPCLGGEETITTEGPALCNPGMLPPARPGASCCPTPIPANIAPPLAPAPRITPQPKTSSAPYVY